jgi:hypothetical protein
MDQIALAHRNTASGWVVMATDGRAWNAELVSDSLPLTAMIDEALALLARHGGRHVVPTGSHVHRIGDKQNGAGGAREGIAGKPKPVRSTTVKAAADRAEARARGEPIDEPKVPIDPPIACSAAPEPKRVSLGDLPPPPDAPEIKIGSPTKYDPETMLAKVVELGRFGKSKAQIARQLGVCDKTLAAWVERHPEFAEAMQTARTLSLAWWDDQGQIGVFLGSKEFNTAAWHTQVKARFPAEYRDVTAHEVTGRKGNPIEVEHSDIEVARRVAFALQRAIRKMEAETVEPVSTDGKVVAISSRRIDT